MEAKNRIETPVQIKTEEEKTAEAIRLQKEAKFLQTERYCPKIQKKVPVAGCTFCNCGHIINCHFPLSCEEANCYDENGNRVRYPVTNEDGTISELF